MGGGDHHAGARRPRRARGAGQTARRRRAARRARCGRRARPRRGSDGDVAVAVVERFDEAKGLYKVALPADGAPPPRRRARLARAQDMAPAAAAAGEDDGGGGGGERRRGGARRRESDGRAASTLRQARPAVAFTQVVCRQMMGLVLLVYVREWLPRVRHAARLLGRTACRADGQQGRRRRQPARPLVVDLPRLRHLRRAAAVDARNLEHASCCSASTSRQTPPRPREARRRRRRRGRRGGGGLVERPRRRPRRRRRRDGGDESLPTRAARLCAVVRRPQLPHRPRQRRDARARVRGSSPARAARSAAQGAARRRLRRLRRGSARFAPTYKFDVGTDTFDTSEKRRPPAWCDRSSTACRARRGALRASSAASTAGTTRRRLTTDPSPRRSRSGWRCRTRRSGCASPPRSCARSTRGRTRACPPRRSTPPTWPLATSPLAYRRAARSC